VRRLATFILSVIVAAVALPAPVFAQLNLTPQDLESIYRGSEFYDPTQECSTITYSGESNTQIAYNYFVSSGFSKEQAAGLVGNFLIESAGTMDPKIKQGGGTVTSPTDSSGKPGRGIAQWEYSAADGSGRWDTLLNYAELRGIDPLILTTQLDFVMFELIGEPSVEGISGGYKSDAYNALVETSTVETAAVAVSQKYEINKAAIDFSNKLISYEAAFSARIDAANEVYDAFANFATTNTSYDQNCERNVEDLKFDIVVGDTTDIPCEGQTTRQYDADGYKSGQRYRILVCVVELPDGSAGPHVNSQISGQVYAMLQDAWSDGVEMTGGGFRTMAQQIELRTTNGCPDIYDSPSSSCSVPTARPGYSNHQMGLAIDFHGVHNNATVDGYKADPNNETWVWLTNNANFYGLYQYTAEAWHWSVDGR